MSTKPFVVPRLSAMMFLEFFVWGAWYATGGLVLAKSGLSSIIGTVYSVGAIAAIIAPFFLGMVVDRFFASEKVLGLLHIVGGILLWLIPGQIKAGNGTALVWLVFIYMLTYMPTLALTNNVAFHNIPDSVKHFPVIRVFGTIGWIVAGLLIGQLGFSDHPTIFQIAAGAAILLGLFSFTLPHTPAPAKGKPLSVRDLLCLDALQMLKDKNYLVFIVCSLLICVPLAVYYSFTSPFLGAVGFQNVGSVMTIGQMSEIFFMLLIPFFFRHLGVKYMLLVGMIAWTARYLLFGFGAPAEATWFMYLGIALHGICYDFFFVTGFIYAEQKAGEKIKGQAQSLLVLFTQGIGMYFGNMIAGQLFNSIVTAQGKDALVQWQTFWFYPAIAAAVIAVVFFVLFREKGLSAASTKTYDNAKA
ncbi:MFS transporter [Anoxybacillus geothermalis]|uniref:MFS transporter n=1 Tax=Geobacillus stearothermophilus TaxID=1422 RepID=UPI001C7CA703|nr:MFS transporter [Geobacillus stearothermophilus]MED4924592.1 MFS transporter [Anoxybacillus geothermalis]WJQ05936.1 MFS transporter [Geobacillus stearothermophilus]